MAISLAKGQKVDLTKGNPGLSKILIGLGWDIKRYDGGDQFDLAEHVARQRLDRNAGARGF